MSETEDSWIDWVPDLIDAIAAGDFDGKLLDLATAIALRMSSEGELKLLTVTAVNRAKALGYVKPTSGTPARGTAAVPPPGAPMAIGVRGETMNVIKAIGLTTAYKRKPLHTFELNGRYFRKADVVDQVFRIKGAGTRSFFLENVPVRVVKADDKFCQVRFEGDPTSAHESYRLVEMWKIQQDDPEWSKSISYDLIKHGFES